MQNPQRYLQHPDQIELKLLPLDTTPPDPCTLLPLGLSLTTNAPHACGEWLRINAPMLASDLHISALVTDCIREGKRYTLKLAFLTQEQLFKARMLEQLCQITLYQRNAPAEESEKRALDWIAHQAAHFPSNGI